MTSGGSGKTACALDVARQMVGRVDVIERQGDAPRVRQGDKAACDLWRNRLAAQFVMADIADRDADEFGHLAAAKVEPRSNLCDSAHAVDDSGTTNFVNGFQESHNLPGAPGCLTIPASGDDVKKFAKHGTVTDENRDESRRLLSIWSRMKPTLAAKGYGTQESFGHQFGIGNQSAVGHFLNGRAAISPKAAAAFAAGLECKIADFSPRLAKLLHETSEAPHAAPIVQARPRDAEAPGVIATLADLAAMLQLVPAALRDSIARELALLANVPDSQTVLARLGEALSSFGAAPGRRQADQTSGARNRGRVLSQRLESIEDRDRRDRIYVALERLIDRETLGAASRLSDTTPDHSPKSMPARAR